MVYIGISYSVDFIWDFPIVIGKPIHFGDSWLDPPVLLPSPYHNPRLDLFQIFYTLLTSLNVRISRGLEEFHSLNLAKSALVTRIRKDDWSRAVLCRMSLVPDCLSLQTCLLSVVSSVGQNISIDSRSLGVDPA